MMSEKELINIIAEIVCEEDMCIECKIRNIATLIHSYENQKDDDEECTYPEYMIQKIAETETEDLTQDEMSFLIEMLVSILNKYDLLPLGRDMLEENSINVSEYSHRELTSMLEVVVDSLTNIVYDYGIFG